MQRIYLGYQPTLSDLAANEIREAAMIEEARLNKEKAKAVHQEFLDFLTELLKAEDKDKSDRLKRAEKMHDKTEKKDQINIIKLDHAKRVGAIKAARLNIKNYPQDHSPVLIGELLTCCEPLSDAKIPSIIDYAAKSTFRQSLEKIMQDRFNQADSVHDVLAKKLRAVTALRHLKIPKKPSNQDLINSINSVRSNDKSAFDALNKRRGDSTFWKVIDAILKRLKKPASTHGVKSALFQNKLNQTLFKATEESLPKISKAPSQKNKPRR